jgi:uncharacterized Fe-S cluster-containing protein
MTMMDLKKQLVDLKNAAENGEISVEEIQGKLSVLLLSNCQSLDQENFARKLDNEMELIVFTLKADDQMNASLKIIDEAILNVGNRLDD